MREKKFRGKPVGGTPEHILGEEWIYGAYLKVKAEQDHVDGHFILSQFRLGAKAGRVWNSPIKLVEVDPKTVGEFIGEEDINKSEIYEGDIVDLVIGSDEGPEEVYFELAAFDTHSRKISKNEDLLIVLGNIHDNPELLGERL